MEIVGFIITNILLGIGLAMDAFSVSLVDGLNEPNMRKTKMSLISFVFGFFQMAMPLIGWLCVHTLLEYFKSFERFIPWIALGLLLYIGGKMLIDGLKNNGSEDYVGVDFKTLIIQGVATAIDALSVGFTIAEYDIFTALIATFIIGLVTYVISFVGLGLGKKFGTKFSNKASILGGVILIGIGLEIFIKGVFF